jgi:BASS family bile acid:Na+ symporter
VRCRLYTPFLATLLVVFIVGSMMSTNVEVVSRSGWQIISAVFTLHSSGFALGYFISKAMGLSDKICRTNSIEVRGGGGRGRRRAGERGGLQRSGEEREEGG